MFLNIGGYEILVVAVAALIIIGPEKLPSVMRQVGKYAAQLRNLASTMREEFMSGMDGIPDLTNLDNWLGIGGDEEPGEPVVPHGFADQQKALDPAATPPPARGTDDATADPASTGLAWLATSNPTPPPDADASVDAAVDWLATPARTSPPSSDFALNGPSERQPVIPGPINGDDEQLDGATGAPAVPAPAALPAPAPGLEPALNGSLNGAVECDRADADIDHRGPVEQPEQLA